MQKAEKKLFLLGRGLQMKKVFKRISALVTVLALGLILMACGSQTAEITVTNSSQFAVDATVTVCVLMQGRSDPLESLQVARGSSASFSVDSGDYRIRVRSGAGSVFWFPQDGSHMHMSGSFQLNFNGNSVTRN